jgi:exodeoxyribonuclease VII large subunit
MNENSRQMVVIKVSELNRRAREIVEGGLPLLWVSGEISNFTRAVSGHCYFSLKDERAQVRCVLFRHRAARLEFAPDNGVQVEVCALPTIYEARGEFQLGVETMRRAGLGALYETFERLRRKLAAEGLFDAERKRELPAFPSSVGIVTSPAAAAFRDVLTTLRRRMPSIPVVLYPAPVQGKGAGEKLAQQVRAASVRSEVDVLIVCRGGGSIEDLWEFNSEALVRAVAQCSIPVVCGIGHDTDYTLTDFVADLRAPTPTAAAAMVTPDRKELLGRLSNIVDALALTARRLIEDQMQRVDYLGKRLVHPGQRVEARLNQLSQICSRLLNAQRNQQRSLMLRLRALHSGLRSQRPDLPRRHGRCEDLALRLRNGGRSLLDSKRRTLETLTAHLEHLNPEAVLSRGYSIVTRQDGLIVRDSSELDIGATVELKLARGRAGARIENKG